jgi:hypothetical protein
MNGTLYRGHDQAEMVSHAVDEVVAVDAVSDLLSFVPEDAVREAGSNASCKFLANQPTDPVMMAMLMDFYTAPLKVCLRNSFNDFETASGP